ncbi:MAG: Hpt domain-containing protein [Phormidesmis sp.]
MLRSSLSAQSDFDWQQLRQLAGGDASFELELIAIFLEDTEKTLQQLEQAITHQDIQAIIELAHTVRGSSANVGARAIARTARRLEQVTHHSRFSSSLTEAFTTSFSEPLSEPFLEAGQLLGQMRHHYQRIQAQFQSHR